MKHGPVPLQLADTWAEYWLMQDGVMKLSYQEFLNQPAEWVDDLALISRLVSEYRESQQVKNQTGATLGKPNG